MIPRYHIVELKVQKDSKFHNPQDKIKTNKKMLTDRSLELQQ